MKSDEIKFSFVEGLFDNKKLELFVKLIESFNSKYQFLVTSVSPDDADRLQEMVTPCALFVGDDVLSEIESDTALCVMLKKLSVAVRYAISGFKMVIDYGAGREERDCTFSIVTSSVHIHLPLDVPDKKLERCVSSALSLAKSLLSEGKTDYLCFYNKDSDKMICESKDDYVRRKYLDSGMIDPDNI